MPKTSIPIGPRRRWFRLSLRSLFVFITLLAMVMGWVTYERAQSSYELDVVEEQLAAQAVFVEFGGAFDDPAQPSEKQSLWRRQLGSVLGPRILRIEVIGQAFTDLKPLTGLKNLERLNLDGTQVRDLTPPIGLQSVRVLSLKYTQVRDLKPLARLKNLQQLSVSYPEINFVEVIMLKQVLPTCKIDFGLESAMPIHKTILPARKSAAPSGFGRSRSAF